MIQDVAIKNNSAVIYTIDKDDHIIYVNEPWDMFASDNESSHLEHDKVKNRLIWDFIADTETRHVHKVLIERVRNELTTLAFPFRCDSPSIRRYMQMQIMPAPDDAISYHCSVERIEHRAPLLFEEEKYWRGKKTLRMCSWCKKIDVGDNVWLEIESAIQKLKLFERKLLPKISHTMCDECIKTLESS